MNRKNSRAFIITRLGAVLVLCLGTMLASAQNIDVNFKGIRSAKGQVMLKVFTDEQTYQDNKPLRTLKISKKALASGALNTKLDLPPGTYGLALLDDENGSGKMDYNFVGMPKEGFGFSNFYLSGMKKPHFNDFKFTVKGSEPVVIEMKLRYL